MLRNIEENFEVGVYRGEKILPEPAAPSTLQLYICMYAWCTSGLTKSYIIDNLKEDNGSTAVNLLLLIEYDFGTFSNLCMQDMKVEQVWLLLS